MIKIKNNNGEIKNKIIQLLKKTTIGESSTEIAKQIGHNRLTVSKYMGVLQAEGVVSSKEVAQARLWKLVEKENKPNIFSHFSNQGKRSS